MEPDEIAVSIVAGLLEARTGQKLTEDRRWRIGPALSGLFRERGISSNQDLVVLLTQPDESSLAQDVVEALLNNETYFFRDRMIFDQLSHKVLPEIARRRAAEKRLSIWCVGCSTGQEPLSLSMLFTEQRSRWADWQIEILGTDVSGSVIEYAREASYSQFQIQRGLSVAQMLGFFEETPNGWRARNELRRLTRYELHNLLDPVPYPGRFDLVLCRNVLLYFDEDTRARAFNRMDEALASGGFLVLGGGENVIGRNKIFAQYLDCPSILERDPKAGARQAA